MSILVITVDLDCCRCKKTIEKALECLKEDYCIEKIEYEDKNNKVIVRGKFDAEKLRKKIYSKACNVVKDIIIVPEWPPKKPESEKKPCPNPCKCCKCEPEKKPDPKPCKCCCKCEPEKKPDPKPCKCCCKCDKKPETKPCEPEKKPEKKPDPPKPTYKAVPYPYPVPYPMQCQNTPWWSCPPQQPCHCCPKPPAPTPEPPKPPTPPPPPPPCSCNNKPPTWPPCNCSRPPIWPPPICFEDNQPPDACSIM